MSTDQPTRVRSCFLIDGFNLYHSIRDNPALCDYRWLDVDSLCRCFIAPSREVVTQIYFFTALPDWDRDKRQRHQRLLRIYEDRGVTVRYGQFIDGARTCMGSCKETYCTREEKNTDINICLELLRLGRDNLADQVFLVTADSDQSASIREFKNLHPEKRVIVIFPPGRHSAELKQVAHGDRSISLQQLKSSMLPDPYTCKNGSIISKPERWKSRPQRFPTQFVSRRFTS